MTVSIQVTTNQKDPVYKPPPPTVARPAASTATAIAILTPQSIHTPPLTPLHSLVKDLLQKQRLVLSWSSLRLIISRGIYPSSSFLTTPGSTQFPDLSSTQVYYSKTATTIDSDKLPQESMLLGQTVVEVPSLPTKDFTTPTTTPLPILSSAPCTRTPKSNKQKEQPASSNITEAATTQQQPTPGSIEAKTTYQQPTSDIITKAAEKEQQSEPSITTESTAGQIGKDTPPNVIMEVEINEVDFEEATFVTEQPTMELQDNGSTTSPSTTGQEIATTSSYAIGEGISTTKVDNNQEEVRPLSPLAVEDPSLSGNPHHQQEDITNMETGIPDDSTFQVSVPAPMDEASLFTEPATTTQQMEPSTMDSLMDECQPPSTSNTSTSESTVPALNDSNGNIDLVVGECQQPIITSSTLLPRPSVNGAQDSTPSQPSAITSSTLLPRPSRTVKVPSKSPIPCNEASAMDICESPVSSNTPLPRPSRTAKVPSRSSTRRLETSAMDICESPISSNTPLPLSRSNSSNSSKSNNNNSSNSSIPPKRNSKLPIRASSSTPPGLLSTKRPGAAPTSNKRRAIPFLFSPSTPVSTPPPPPETKTRMRPDITKMDHVLEEDDEVEEERPKPISRKEKLARQAKRAEQIKFYRVREEREQREQRVVARRRLMAPKNRSSNNTSDGNTSDSSSTSSSKGVKFNLHRNRVIEIQQDPSELPPPRSKIPHSTR
ncbi:hypothetical protein BC941DRAFT_512005 [Chlamydoabsidia padenii]|nr:hypothetical protein BC941DRAFT_512005 [Chlamydoabsidia padenii]